jgi:hypothetical protein
MGNKKWKKKKKNVEGEMIKREIVEQGGEGVPWEERAAEH